MLRSMLRRSVNCIPGQMRPWIRHIPGLALGQRWLVTNILNGGPFLHVINSGPARGLRFEITLPEDKAIWAGTFESQVSRLLQEAVRRGDVCYDIGGYRGYMAGVMAVAGAARVIIFEPFNENVLSLERFAQLNPKLRLQIEALAIMDREGEVSFHIMPDPSMGKMADSPYEVGRASVGTTMVRVCTLDACIFERGLPRPNFIKVDVEGAEHSVLKGGQRTLAECRPILLLEAHSAKLADLCVRTLKRHAYDVQQLEQGQVDPDAPRHLMARPR